MSLVDDLWVADKDPDIDVGRLGFEESVEAFSFP
jgi:hypothetical protein